MSNDIKDRLALFRQQYQWRMMKKCDPLLLDDLEEATSFLQSAATVAQRAWHIDNNTNAIPKCSHCGESVKWDPTTSCYREFCCVRCHNQHTIANCPLISSDEIVRRWNALTGNQQRTVRVSDPVLYQQIIQHTHYLDGDVKHGQRMWHVVHGPDTPVCACDGCIVHTKWNASHSRYELYCSQKCAARSIDVQTKRRTTSLERHGVEYFCEGLLSSQSREALQNVEWLRDQHHDKQLTLSEIATMLECDHTTVWNYFRKHNIAIKRFGASIQERELVEQLSTTGILVTQNDRSIIKPLELDVYVPEHHIAVEMCGLRWHSDQFKDKWYHYRKREACADVGVRLFTIFDDEWHHRRPQIMRKILMACGRGIRGQFGARECSLEIVPYTQSIRLFYNEHHIQGYVRATHHIEIRHNESVIGYASVNAINGECEIVRVALKHAVVGILSRLVAFIRRRLTLHPIVTFADLRYDSGDVYVQSGFVLDGITAPTYYYGRYTAHGPQRFHRSLYQRKHLPKRLQMFDPALTEFENCNREPNLYRVWDCGKARFIHM